MSFATVLRGNSPSFRELLSGFRFIAWLQSGDGSVILPRGVNGSGVNASSTILSDEVTSMETPVISMPDPQGISSDAGMNESAPTSSAASEPKGVIVASPPETAVVVNAAPEADAMTEMQRGLFRLLQDVQLEPDGFNIAPALHRIFCDVGELEHLCTALVTPFIMGKSTQPIAAVIGLGGCGSVLASAVARCLSQSSHSQDSRAVAFLPMEIKSGEQPAFVDMALAGKMLRGKQVLIVTPIMTPANTQEIQDMIRVVEGDLNANATVHSVVTLLSLQCCELLNHASTKRSLVKVWNGLKLSFGT
jgi:hypothetical protein